MKQDAVAALAFLLLLAGGTAGARPDAAGSGETDAVEVDDKAARKISMAIGEEVGDFTVIGQERVEAGAGSDATEYTVRTDAGKAFKCRIIEPSRAGRIFSFGTASGADALCTEFANPDGGKNARARGTTRGNSGGAGARPEPAVAIAIGDKAARKISMAIGEETDAFVVTRRDDVDSSVGMKGTEYTVRTNGGKTYKCQILEPSGLGRIVSFGTAGGADALCTDFTKGSPNQGKTNQANCNALLRAAHKCD